MICHLQMSFLKLLELSTNVLIVNIVIFLLFYCFIVLLYQFFFLTRTMYSQSTNQQHSYTNQSNANANQLTQVDFLIFLREHFSRNL